MMDRFDIQRSMDSAGERASDAVRARLEEERERERARKARLIKLSPGYYFDPLEKALLKRTGSQFGFVKHDRRYERGQKAVLDEAAALGLRPVAGALFWDPKGKRLYRKVGARFVLYSRDRRKAKVSSGSKDRRGV